MSVREIKMGNEFIEQQESKPFKLGGPGFLQTFADTGDDQGDDDQGDDDLDDDEPGDDDPGDDDPGDDDSDDDDAIEYSKGSIDAVLKSGDVDFAQLLKDNPILKKQYQERFNKNMSKRLDKFKDVDVDEYHDLKARAESGKLEGDAKTWKDKFDALQTEMVATSQKTAIQEFGIESGLDAEQIAFVSSMIKLNKIEQDDEGEWMGIDDEVDRIREKFPRMFESKKSDQTDDDDQSDKKKKSKYNPGGKKHNQDSKPTDPLERGRQRAKERHNRNKK